MDLVLKVFWWSKSIAAAANASCACPAQTKSLLHWDVSIGLPVYRAACLNHRADVPSVYLSSHLRKLDMDPPLMYSVMMPITVLSAVLSVTTP